MYRNIIRTCWNKAAFAKMRLYEFLRNISFFFRAPISPYDFGYSYRSSFILHNFTSKDAVLDIGSGGCPFPHATILADRFIEPTCHRTAKFISDGRPVVICDIHQLPFRNKSFDYLVCSHVLEHIDNPIKACEEIQRVSNAGYIETPSFLKDALFAWAHGMHKWHVVSIKNCLVFFEYTERQSEGIRGSEWREIIFGDHYHPLQQSFANNQDIFNVLFEWKDSFDVLVMRLDGTVEYSRYQGNFHLKDS